MRTGNWGSIGTARLRSALAVRSVGYLTSVMLIGMGFLALTSTVQVSGQDSSVGDAAKPSNDQKTPISAEVWNQWRGPRRTAELAGSSAWPDSLQLKLEWKVDSLGPSYSGPVTDGDCVFTTETVDRKTEVVTAFDLKTGERRWQQRWEGSMTVPFFAASNGSWIRSTPACDKESVYVVGMQDVLYCLSAQDGSVKWKRDFASEYKTGNPPFGAVCSPLLEGDVLYLQAANRCFKLNRKTGETIWESMQEEGGMSTGGSFSSPSMATLQGRRQLLVQSRMTLAGLSPETGEVLWSTEVPNFRGMNILTPIAWEESVFTSSYNQHSFLYRVDGGEVSLGWKNPAKGYMASPAVVDGHAYLLLQNGRLACLNLETGERTWTSEESYGDYLSCIVNGRQILALSNEGQLSLINANPEYLDVEGQTELEGVSNSWAHIGIFTSSDDKSPRIIIRSIDSLRLYSWGTTN